MKYKLIAEVEGLLFISESIEFEFQNITYEFIMGEDGRLTNVAVSKVVPENKISDFQQTFEPGNGDVKLKISIGGDKELHDELVKELQVIESNLAFSSQASLKRIRWDISDQEYIPENQKDESLIAISSLSKGIRHNKLKVKTSTKSIEMLIKLAANYETLSTPKAFWREGMIYMENTQYIQAFYQFYFVIEDFYISGKSSSKKSVMKKFQQSEELIEIAKNTLSTIFDLPNHKKKLEEHLTEYKCQTSPIGLLEMLYEARNNLHHFHSRSTRTQGTPFNQSIFHTIALVTMHIATSAIVYREVNISQKRKLE
jgi:hypothetical protein